MAWDLGCWEVKHFEIEDVRTLGSLALRLLRSFVFLLCKLVSKYGRKLSSFGFSLLGKSIVWDL